MKIDSLYNDGMKVCLFSKSKYENENIGWYRGCSDINYSKNES